jgi:hypothetical protein
VQQSEIEVWCGLRGCDVLLLLRLDSRLRAHASEDHDSHQTRPKMGRITAPRVRTGGIHVEHRCEPTMQSPDSSQTPYARQSFFQALQNLRRLPVHLSKEGERKGKGKRGEGADA